jgi:glycosyltransferase involved in cell wall biosynthesis
LSSIVLIIPAFNEEETISRVVKSIPSTANEVIVVDNGSTDRTGQLAESAGATVITDSRKGYGYACTAGIRYAQEKKADILVFMDGDGSDDPTELEKIVEPILKDEADCVVGSRLSGAMLPGSMTFPQKFGNRLAAFLMKVLYRSTFTDLGPFRAIRATRMQELDMKEMTYGGTVEMQLKVLKHGLRYVEIPVNYSPRLGGKSKVSGTVKGTILAGYMIIKTILKATIK